MPDIPPGLQTVVPSNGFFEWASLSPPSRASAEARRRSLESSLADVDAPMRARHEVANLDALRHAVRQLAGAHQTSPKVILGRSVSELMSFLAFGLNRPAKRTILIAGNTHPSVVIAWRMAAKRFGDVLTLHDDADPQVFDNRPSIVIATHVDHLYGTQCDIQTIVKKAREAGALSIIDGAQAVGRVHLNFDRFNPDVYLGSGRKSLLAPLGTAFMLIAPELADSLTPSIWSTRSAQLTSTGDVETAIGAPRLEGNLPDMSALAGLHANLPLFTPSLIDRLQHHIRVLLPDLLAGLTDAGLAQAHSVDVSSNTGIASFNLPTGVDGLALQRRLRGLGIVIASTTNAIRVSLHLSNDSTDVLRLVEEVSRYVR